MTTIGTTSSTALPKPTVTYPSGGAVTPVHPEVTPLGAIDAARHFVITKGLRVIENVLGDDENLGTALAKPVTNADPVMLVGGWANDDHSWKAYASSLARDGFDTYVVTVPGNAMQDLNAGAKFVGEKARLIKAKTGAKHVDIVGFSAGGLIARAADRDFTTPGTVDEIVTLGTPNRGELFNIPPVKLLSPFVRVGGGKGATQLLATSDFVQHLNSDPGERKVAHVTSVFNQITDGAVTPPWSSKVNPGTNNPVGGFGKERNVLFIPIGPDHYNMLHKSDTAFEAVRNALIGTENNTLQ